MRPHTIALATLMLVGCPEEGPRPEQADAALGTPDAGLATQAAALEQATLDVLFVVDNSGSMADEQQKLAREIPRMVAVLASGDRYATREAEVPPGLDDKSRRFTPVHSLHLGVVSTNFGGIDEMPQNSPEAVLSCRGNGDAGKLQNSTRIATVGVTASNNSEFKGFAKGAVVLSADPSCDLGTLPLYQEFAEGDASPEDAHAFGCAARLGVRGCPFEQPLESMWNALAPSKLGDELHSFLNGVRGNGDRDNAGFLRPGAALAVVVMTDEDDCSITEEGKQMFSLQNEAEEEFGNLNLRCLSNEADTRYVRGVERYRDALLGLKPGHPERVVFTALAGMPLDASTRSLDSMLADPSMVNAEDPAARGFPRAVCDGAYPARRLLRTAALFPNALAESICAENYAPVVDAMVNEIAPLMSL